MKYSPGVEDLWGENFISQQQQKRVEGMMWGRMLQKQLKGKVLQAYLISAWILQEPGEEATGNREQLAAENTQSKTR